VGETSAYSTTSRISVNPMRLPMNSGVRPTMSPPTKTAISTAISSPYRPLPVPPAAISPSIIAASSIPPPRLEKLS
jgi:hypothetical protein